MVLELRILQFLGACPWSEDEDHPEGAPNSQQGSRPGAAHRPRRQHWTLHLGVFHVIFLKFLFVCVHVS